MTWSCQGFHAGANERRGERRDDRVAEGGAHSVHCGGKPINQRLSSGFNTPRAPDARHSVMVIPEARTAASSILPLYRVPVRPPPPTLGVGHPVEPLRMCGAPTPAAAQIGGPAGIACILQVSAYSGEPFTSMRCPQPALQRPLQGGARR